MDVAPIIAQACRTPSWLIPLLLLIGLLKSLWAKGHIGELLMRLFAHWQLDQQTYHCLHSITLNTPDDTAQIDHVFLSSCRIFVLETKSMCGWIFGNGKQPQWTQRLYKHIFKLQKLQAPKGVRSHSVASPEHLQLAISFVDGSTFRTEVLTNVTQREHVKNSKRRGDPIADGQYPKCGSALLIRAVNLACKRTNNSGVAQRLQIRTIQRHKMKDAVNNNSRTKKSIYLQ